MELTRKELYDLVWSEPMTTICKRFGLSDNGLRKRCKSMNIPTPLLGYWAKLKYNKQVTPLPLQQEETDTIQSTTFQEAKEPKVQMEESVNPYKKREQEICSGDISCFKVPEILYAKTPLIIDTKEKFRQQSENLYLKKNPYKSKIGETLDLCVSENMLERALSIFDTIIKGLIFRGHHVECINNQTYAIIDGEKIQIRLTERRRQNPNSSNRYDNSNNIFSGELQFYIYHSTSFHSPTLIHDTTYTKIEDKIISIVAYLEIEAENRKIERIEAEEREKQRKEEERKREEFEAKKRKELEDVKDLLYTAERFRKTNILREYISAFESHANENGEVDNELQAKIQWAREKADWLDPFIATKDNYLDSFDMDRILQAAVPERSYRYSEYSFWTKPYWKKKR